MLYKPMGREGEVRRQQGEQMQMLSLRVLYYLRLFLSLGAISLGHSPMQKQPMFCKLFESNPCSITVRRRVPIEHHPFRTSEIMDPKMGLAFHSLRAFLCNTISPIEGDILGLILLNRHSMTNNPKDCTQAALGKPTGF